MRLFGFLYVVAVLLLLQRSHAAEESADAEEQYGQNWGVCPEMFYNDGFCHCGCTPGVGTEADCAVTGSDPPVQEFRFSYVCPLPNFNMNQNYYCTELGYCEICDGCNVWTCESSKYHDEVCDCNCGKRDPVCNTDQTGARGCAGGQICDGTGACTYCGNGEVDIWETCDRKSGCCSQDCNTALQDNIDCKNGDGYCSSGICRVPTAVIDIHSAKDAQGEVIRTSSSIDVEWVLANEVNPVADKFCIEKNKKVNGAWTGWGPAKPNVGGNNRYKTVDGLDSGSIYKFRILTKVGPIPKTSAWESTFGISTLA